MSARLLFLDHSVQESGAGCLAACSQMLLGYLGMTHSQQRLNRVLGLTSLGVPYSNLSRLESLGVRVRMDFGDEVKLEQAIDVDLPVIAFVVTGDLPYWSDSTGHALVVVGYDESHLYLHDPAFPTAPQQVRRDEFMLAWSEMDYGYAVITRPPAAGTKRSQ